ncbi:MAG: rhodanese-like domain-containing protein [Desulfocapsaceae bacterium]
MSAAVNYTLFREKIQSISSKQTKDLVSSRELDHYQLVDVRQPGEYAKGHLPGALLIPLSELPARAAELDETKQTIVYCRSGVRSKTACQILTRLGIDKVLNMEGGITSYNGYQVEGNLDSGLEFFVDADFDSAYEMAFAMEAGLKNFYLAISDGAETDEERNTLIRLAQFEDGHMKRLINKFGKVYFNPESTITEGGVDVEQMLLYFGDQLNSRERLLQLAMKLEAQAFDLYSRLAREHQGEDTESFYQLMAVDEHKHLVKISKELDNLL